MFEQEFKEPLKLTNHGIRLPEFQMSSEDRVFYNISENTSTTEILLAICRAGFKGKFDSGLIPQDKKDEYGKRVKYECDVLTKTSFVDYILLVWDVMRFARRKELSIGKGRGSAPGALVNWLIGVTDVDPIKYGLFFERFISEARAKTNVVDGVKYLVGSMPDIDMDFGDEDREIVIDYVRQKYAGRFVKLSTTGTFTTKILSKEVGKFLGHSEEEMNRLTDQIPVIFGKSPDPNSCLTDCEPYRRFSEQNPAFMPISRLLYGVISQVGSHASAYSVSYDSLEDFMPLQLGSDGEIVSTYDMYVAQDLSIKLDLLGVQTINLVSRVAEAAGIDLNSINLDDYDTIYKYLQCLEHPYGLFQISGHTAIRANNKIKPKNIDQLAALLAIARPGAMAFTDQYADYLNNGTIPECPAEFRDTLAATGGVLLFQEQLMMCFVRLGFSLIDANTIRDIVGKKKVDKIAEWEPKIYAMAKQNGISDEAAKYVWDVANASSSYSFNLSHAVAYSLTSAISVYCKFNYPAYFFLEALKMSQKKQQPMEEIVQIVQELPYFGIKLLPPDLTRSEMDFCLEGNDIRYGLSAIKGVAEKALAKLRMFIDNQKGNKFQIFQAAKESGLNTLILSALIQSGCLSSMGSNRARMVYEYQIWNKLNDRERNYLLANGLNYSFDLIAALKEYLNWVDSKPFKATRLDTIRKQTAPYLEIYTKNNKYPEFANYAYESALLGFSHSTSLRSVFEKEHPMLQSCDHVKNALYKDDNVLMVGRIQEVKKWKSKNGNTTVKVTMYDETGTVEAMMCGNKIDMFLSSNPIPAEDEILYVEGKKGEGNVWINRMSVQDYKIAFNIRDLKKLNKEEKKENEQ